MEKSSQLSQTYGETNKVCIVGAAGVGKTSLIRRLLHGVFTSHYCATAGIDRIDSTLILADQKMICFWDIKGCDELTVVSNQTLADTAVYIVVIDPTRDCTIKVAQLLVTQIQAVNAGNPLNLLVLGNKSDQTDHWVSDSAQLQTLFGAVWSVSALTGEGLEALVERLAGLRPPRKAAVTGRVALGAKPQTQIQAAERETSLFNFNLDNLTLED